jgi:hypothetical protein
MVSFIFAQHGMKDLKLRLAKDPQIAPSIVNGMVPTTTEARACAAVELAARHESDQES